MSEDPFDLQRFVDAQALDELRVGWKRSHWMWFVFPQLKGLGRSEMAERYGIASFEEARAYLARAELRPRLLACTEALLRHRDVPPLDALGSDTDVQKLLYRTTRERLQP